MIGNDVVDLKTAKVESNWKRRGFLDKLFTDCEQAQIKDSKKPDELIWVFWSMKESAYKILNRTSGIRAFMPKRLKCDVKTIAGNTILGEVTCDSEIYYCQTYIHDDFIHTVAVEYFKNLQNIAEVPAAARIFKANALPYIFENGRKVPISISHHGRHQKSVMINSVPILI